MKQLRSGLLAGAVFLLGAASAWAEVGVQGGVIGPTTNPLTPVICDGSTAGKNTGCVNLIAGPVYIKGFKHVGTAANHGCQLYNASTTAEMTSANAKDELTEDTAYVTGVQIWPAPILFSDAVSVGFADSTTTCIVYY